jgi:hypothetical protein
MNLPFCLWLARRARAGDTLEIMVHEPFLTFARSWRQYGAAFVHRLMAIILLRSATRVWFSTPEFQRRWEMYRLGRAIPFDWLPVPSNVRVIDDSVAKQNIRRRYIPADGVLIGHFGTYGAPVMSVLDPILSKIGRDMPQTPLLLMGRGSIEYRESLLSRYPEWNAGLHATGPLTSDDLSGYLAACDLFIQPYPDGVTSRRTSLMAALSHGKPVITTVHAKSSEPIWSASGAIACARVGDVASFLDILSRLISDSAERARMSAAARKLYADEFDISRTVAALRSPIHRHTACES